MLVLVTGATGKQGGAVSRKLLARGHRVRAFTRRPTSSAARHLAWLGAEVVAGDLDRPDTLARSLEGVDAMFAVTSFEDGADREAARGIAMVDAARSAGLGHFVFSSAPYAKERTGVPHFDSKRRIEAHAREALIGFTIVAPAFFMENFRAPEWLPAITRGTLAMPLPPAHRVDAVALADLGAFVARVLEQPERFAGQRVDVAGDSFSPAGAAAALSRVMHRTCEYVRVPIEWVRARSAYIARSYEWGVLHGPRQAIDVAALRSRHADLGWQSFEEWCARQSWAAAARGGPPPCARTAASSRE